MDKIIKKRDIFICSMLFIFSFAFFLLPFFSLNAAELNSTNFKVTDSLNTNGAQMNSSSYSISGASSGDSFGIWNSNTLPLAPGNIASCGKITVPGTYTLNSSFSGISGPCFTVATNGVTIDGGGYTVTANIGNTNYAIMATSSNLNGGSAYGNITVNNIIFKNFTGGINASGNNSNSTAGNAGSVTVASSSLGNIVLNGGNSSGNGGGNGGVINISGNDVDIANKIISVNGGSGSPNGSKGTITFNGSILFANNEFWTGDDSSWLGTRTWNFTSNSYNAGTTTGTTTFSNTAYNAGSVVGDSVFLNYSGTNGVVTVNSNENARGTGRVSGNILDSANSPITTLELINGSVLTGASVLPVIFNDTSYNAGIVFATSTFSDFSYNAGTTTNAVFTADSFNSLGGIPNGDPTGISNGHSITGVILFSTSTSPVNFTLNTNSTWRADTTSWLFASLGQNWTFNSSINSGTLNGTAVFTNSQNLGHILATSSFYTNSFNTGTISSALFYANSYNIGVVSIANFYNNTVNSHTVTAGNVLVRCDFYDSSLLGIGSCPSNATYYHTPYYFNNAVSTNWNDLGNWWFDSSFVNHTPNLPLNGDVVFIGRRMDTGPTSPLTLGQIIIASSTTGGGEFPVNITNANGPAYFYASSTNVGEVSGTFHVFSNRSLSQVNTTGTYDGDVSFHDGSWNNTNMPGNAIFNDHSYNSSSGVVNGSAEFTGTNRNDGIINGVAVVDLGASLSGNGMIVGNTSNSGNISGGVFNSTVTNLAGAVTGIVTNLVKMIFNGNSQVASNGTLSGDAEFNSNANNAGTVSGTSTFNNLAYNIGLTANAIFSGDLSENNHGGMSGIVSGIKTRLYNPSSPQTNLFRSFIDSAWTIVADNAFVKLLYSGLIDINGRDANTTTTLVEKNGGFILRPLTASAPINSCGILDKENGVYNLNSDILNYNFDSCFIIRANGITLNGNGHSVIASSSAASIYAIVATSTPSIDSTSSAFTNITVENIKFANFAHGYLGRGNDVVNGIGGNGASSTFINVEIGDIDVSGGDPLEKAGDGGDLYIETSKTTVITSNGGDSTACGIPGNGGNIYITTDSVFATSSNKGGDVSGCQLPQDNHSRSGSSGSVRTNLISAATKAASAAALAVVTNVRHSQQSSSLDIWQKGILNVTLPVKILKPLVLKKMPEFSFETTKDKFSLGLHVEDFLFAPLGDDLLSKFSKDFISYLNSAGFSKGRDFLKIIRNPLKLPLTDKNIAGLFKVSVKNSTTTQEVNTYLTVTDGKNLSEKITLSPNTKFTVSLYSPDTGSIIGKWNGKKVIFVGDNISLTAPSRPGLYLLTTDSSPLLLAVEVPQIKNIIPQNKENIGWFRKIINFFTSIF